MKILQFGLRSAMALCLAFFLSSASCELFEKVDDVTFNVVLEHVFEIDEEFDSDVAISYSDVEILDAAGVNQQFDTYKDKIKEITINKITYAVSEYASSKGNVDFVNGKCDFGSPTANTATVLASLPFTTISGASGTLAINQAGLNEVAGLLEDDKQVKIFSSGSFSKTPVAFKLTVKLDCTITANAL